MKTLIFGVLMGTFGSFAVFLSISMGWPGWVLFLAWICYYLYGKSVKKSLNIYLQIVLGIGLSIGIEVLGALLSQIIGPLGTYLAIFLLVGALAFLVKIRNLHDLTAWFFGFVVFFGAEPMLSPASIAKNLLIPLAVGFILGYTVDKLLTRLIHREATGGVHN